MLFNDEDVEVIGTQMPQHVDGNKDMSMRGETKDMTRKYDDIGKKRCRAVTTKSKVAQKKSKSRRSGVGRFGRWRGSSNQMAKLWDRNFHSHSRW
jgi:hypothetical protein